MQGQVFYPAFAGKRAAFFKKPFARVDAVEIAQRIGGGEQCRRRGTAAMKLAPRKARILPLAHRRTGRRREAVYHAGMIEIGGRRFPVEGARAFLRRRLGLRLFFRHRTALNIYAGIDRIFARA